MATFGAGEVNPKDPGEIKTYTMDWTRELNPGAEILTSAWTIAPDGLDEEHSGISTGNLKTGILLSGGTAGVEYTLTNEVTTSDGETLRISGIVHVSVR